MTIDSTDSPPTAAAPDLQAADRIGRALTRLLRTAARAKARTASLGGDLQALPVLWTLREAGPLRANELADAMLTDPSTVSRQVAQLVEAGYVERLPDPDDGRASRLVLTAAGTATLEDGLRRRTEFLAAVTRSWSAADREQLAVLLDRFAADLTTHQAELERATVAANGGNA
jgi:DNA-binding MarR family transcriptional regulator